MKKAISILLSIVIAFSVVLPGLNGLDFATVEAGAASVNASDAYSTLFTVSDLQNQNYLKTVESIMTQITEGGVPDTPDALLFGGDFQTSSNYEEDVSNHMDAMEGLFNDFYPYYHTKNLVYIKGNHDALNDRHYETGLHEFEDFVVYVINEEDFSAGNLSEAKTASENLKVALDRLLATGNDKPIFVMTHVPIHHNSRGSYGQSAYGRYLFNVLNQYGAWMDIVFMFGHNHSGTYDDYIGGSVNYLGVGDTIYISSYDGEENLEYGETKFKAETLNFTYMNYGYGAYANNTEGTVTDTVHGIGEVQSTNTLTMGVLEICPDRIIVSRYSPDGKYGESETINRKTPANEDGSYDEPYVKVVNSPDGNPGVQYGAYANATGFENPVYSWKSSNTNIATVTGDSPVAQVQYLAASNNPVTITVTVSEADGSVSKEASYSFKVTGEVFSGTGTDILMGTAVISNQTLEFYNIDQPYQLYLIGHYAGATNVTSPSWSSSDTTVATVENGLVTFVGNGDVTITYSIVNNGTTYKSTTTFVVSNGSKQELSDEIVGYTDEYHLTSTLNPGNKYVFYCSGKNFNSVAGSSSAVLTGTANDTAKKQLKHDTTISPVNDVITTTNTNVVWECIESGTSGKYYLRNVSSGQYLATTRNAIGDAIAYLFTTVDDLTTYEAEVYQFAIESYSVGDGSYVPVLKGNTTNSYVRYNDSYFYSSSSPAIIAPYQAGTILADAETEEHIELGADFVEGTTQTIYNVTGNTAIRVYGAYTNYGHNVVESWSSSNSSVATIDQDGNIDFTGTAGETTITYKIKSDTISERTLTFTLAAKNGREATRTFKYVKELKTDRPYVFVYKSDVTAGEGYALSTNKLTKKAMFPEDITVKYNDVGDYLYVEVPESDSDDLVWTTGGTSSDFVYISTEESIQYTWWDDRDGDGEKDGDELTYTDDYVEGLGVNAGVKNDFETTQYLGAKITGYGTWGVEGELYTVSYGDVLAGLVTSLLPHQFHLKSDELYNDYEVSVSNSDGSKSYSGYTAVGYHSSNYFGIGNLSSSYSQELMAFEEVFPDPTAVIESNYEYIGKKVTRNEICQYQTEQLVANAQNFPEGTKTVTWTSSDTSVATIDQNGLLTYTGKAGITEISLTITVTNDVDGTVTDTQSVTITVNADQIVFDGDNFYETKTLVAGNEYIFAHIKDGNVYTVSNNDYIASDGNFVKADTENKIISSTTDYIKDPTASSVWKCEASGEEGYFYLRDQSGRYLSVDYTKPRSFYPYDSLTDLADSDCFLLYYDSSGYLRSKGSGDGGASFNLGTTTPRFQVSSTKAKFTLFGRGSQQAEPEGDIYNLTHTLQDGKKYIIANTMLEGETYVATTNLYTDNKTPRLAVEAVETADDGTLYIENPENALVLTAVQSEKSGYFYLVDENGKYLTIYYHREIDAAGNKGTATTFVALCDLDEYNRVYNQLRYYYSTGSDLCRLHNAGGETIHDDGSKTVTSGYLQTLNTSSSNPRLSLAYYTNENTVAYMYELQEKESGGEGDGEVTIANPVTQIRVNGREGTSKNITSTVYNRYYITSGKTEQFLRYVANVNEGYTYEWTSSDTSIATVDKTTGLVTYTGKEGYVTLTLKVSGTGFNGEAYSETVSATLHVFNGNYVVSDVDQPEYPYDGSVRVNKTASNTAGGMTFQNSGVTEIELGVTGVPVSQPMDVVIILDHSSSMNGGTMLEDCIENTQNFALQILDANPNNRVAVAAFDSISKNYSAFDSKNYQDNFKAGEAGVVTGNGTVEGAFVTPADEKEMMEQIDALITNNISNTNYDYGMKIAYDILASAKEKGSENKQVVVFMSDGAPNQFNGLGVSPDQGAGNAWVKGDETNAELATYLADTETYPVAKLFNTDGDNWYGVAIKTPEGQATGVPDHEFYDGYETGLGAKIFTIGYAAEDTYGILSRMASSRANYYYAQANLQAAYDEILNQILQAATDAVVTDKMGDQFDVQFATSFQFGTSTLTLEPAPKFEIGYWTLDNNGNRIAYSVNETITFTTNENGKLTAADSSVIGSCYDVQSNKIIGHYVTYDLLNETFTWNVGEINRTEITLKYYACLEGAATGDREAGTYDTNDYATLSYTNFRGTENCSKVFPVPTLAWDQAAISYDFYLVNTNGQTINLNGVVVPFAERVTIGREQTKKIHINSDGTLTYTLIALNEIPEGYELYNEDAEYTITVSGSTGTATISDSTLTTYYRDGSYAVNVNGAVPNVSSYTNTAVSFAVKASEGVVPDSIVIDYGLPVKINVLGNDYVADGGVITGVAKAYASGATFNSKGNSASVLVNGGLTDVATDYGKATVVKDANVYGQYYIVYTPATTNMPEEDVFYYEYKVGDVYYCTKVTVIPATNIYYEESFMTFVDGQDGYKWEDVGTAITGKFQAEDRPGTFSFSDFDADNAYGEDPAYDNGFTYSLGSAMKTTVDAAAYQKEATAEFTFCGTGFDLFSVTSNETGAVQVTIYKTGTTTIVKNFLVNTYYGYKLSDGVPLPDLGSTAGLYQVPIISRRDLAYGTYDVVIKPLYSSAFDPNYDPDKDRTQNDYSIYVDSVRIFNPAGESNDAIADVYYKDGEYAPFFKEIRETVLSSDVFYDEVVDDLGYSGSIFLDGNKENGIGESALATYRTQGPKNEVYLGKGQAIAFVVTCSADEEYLADLQLGMKVVSGGDTATVTFMNTNEAYSNSIAINSAHESFKSINSAVHWDPSKVDLDENTKGTYPIVIANTSEENTVISLTSFKWAHSTPPENSESTVNFMVYGDTPEMATMALRKAMAASEESDEGTYNESDITMTWSDESFVEGKEATLKVTTPLEVVKVTVGGIEIDKCEIDADGNKLWTYSFVVQQAGENAYEVIFYDYLGDESEPVMTETIYAEEAEDEPPADDPASDDSAFEKALQKLADIFSKVLSFLKSIIKFFWRLF